MIAIRNVVKLGAYNKNLLRTFYKLPTAIGTRITSYVPEGSSFGKVNNFLIQNRQNLLRHQEVALAANHKRYFSVEQKLSNQSDDQKLINEYLEKADNLVRAGNFHEAIKNYDEALILGTSNDEAVHIMKGIALFSAHRFTESIDCFNNALDINPASGKAYFLKGEVFTRTTHYTAAIECFNRAISFGYENAQCYYSKGDALAKIGQKQAAEECIKKAKQMEEASRISQTSVMDDNIRMPFKA
jgi:tetratricopeptide (TPR) repeat protein